MNLKISNTLELPLQVGTEKLAWLGVTGGGKTYAATKMAELLWYAGVQFVVLDPVGVWYGLRLAKDGKSPSAITIPIFGGLHGDIPIDPGAGAVIADLIVDRRISVIIDVSQFEHDSDKTRFACDFAVRFYFRKKASPSAVHLFMEEVQEFVPQNPQKGEERMLHAFVRMQKLGRNFGIGSSYISQRPQEVNKKALNMAQTLFVFRTTGSHERESIEKWMKDKSLEQSIADDLPKLRTGDCHVWSPAWLGISHTIRVLEKDTFNASATPEVGAEAAQAVELAPIDLENLRSTMAKTIEQAAAEDPKELRKQLKLEKEKSANLLGQVAAAEAKVTELAEQLANRPKSAKLKKIMVPTFGKRSVAALKASEDVLRGSLQKMRELHKAIENSLNVVDAGVETFATERAKMTEEQVRQEQQLIEVAGDIAPHIHIRIPESHTKQEVTKSVDTSAPAAPIVPLEQLAGPHRRILDAIAWFQSAGVPEPSNAAVAFLANYSPKSSSYQNPRAELRAAGLIEYRSDGLALTEAGSKQAKHPARALNNKALHDMVLGRLPGPERKLLAVLLEHYPRDVTNAELAHRTNYSPSSSSYQNPRARLKAIGLATYPSDSRVRAADFLFIEKP